MLHSEHVAGSAGFTNSGLPVGTLLGVLQVGKPPAELSDGMIVGLGSRDFGVLVTTLSCNSRSNLLSTPSLLTLDNQKAEAPVGQNVPFQTGSYTTSTSGSSNPFTIAECRGTGVILKVTPHIGEDRMSRLEIEQEISSIAPIATLVVKAVNLVINKRSIKGTILVDDDQVIVLGGLIQDDLLCSDSQVPLLGDIPGAGRLFHLFYGTRAKCNLMVFLRPSIVRDAVDLERVSHGRYHSAQLLRGAAGEPVRSLFEDTNVIDLRPAAQVTPCLSYTFPSP